MYPKDKALILFDGVCNLCNASVNFIIDRDSQDHFRMASLQSDLGQFVLREYAKPLSEFDSILLVQNGKVYEKSTAALLIASQLTFPWSLLRFFLYFPVWIRDPIYLVVARNRYRLFGKQTTCRLPTEKDRHKIIG